MSGEFICSYCNNTGIVPSVSSLMQDFCRCNYGERQYNLFLYKIQINQTIEDNKKLLVDK